MNKYDDIINMKRPISKKHSPMPLENRAAQFAPFAALTGYDDAVEETARITDRKIELSEEEKSTLDDVLLNIERLSGTDPKVRITFFVPDEVKEGGEYVTSDFTVKNIDTVFRRIVLKDKSTISIDNVFSLEIIDDK